MVEVQSEQDYSKSNGQGSTDQSYANLSGVKMPFCFGAHKRKLRSFIESDFFSGLI